MTLDLKHPGAEHSPFFRYNILQFYRLPQPLRCWRGVTETCRWESYKAIFFWVNPGAQFLTLLQRVARLSCHSGPDVVPLELTV